MIDVVDENDQVIGVAEREELYQKSLRHRIVHVLVFNKKGEMSLQLRTDKVKFCPNHWSTSAGGHVESGESYEQAAKRELKEELGIEKDLKFIGKDIYNVTDELEKFVSIYKVIYEGDFNYDKNDISKVKYFPIGEIKNMINSGEKIHPELKYIINKYY